MILWEEKLYNLLTDQDPSQTFNTDKVTSLVLKEGGAYLSIVL